MWVKARRVRGSRYKRYIDQMRASTRARHASIFPTATCGSGVYQALPQLKVQGSTSSAQGHPGCGLSIRAQLWAPSYRRPSSPPSIMSTTPSTPTSHSNFKAILDAALESYKSITKKDLASHPLFSSLQSCNSSDAILAILQEQTLAFNEFRSGDNRLTKSLIPTVNVLHSFSETIGQSVGAVNITTFRCGEFLP